MIPNSPKAQAIDPDLQALMDNWPELTPWQRKLIVWRVTYCLLKHRIQKLIMATA